MLVEQVEASIERLGLAGESILVAVSGGVDSTVLLHVLRQLSERHGLKLQVGHVDHGLRGEQGQAECQAVRRQARAMGIGFAHEAVSPETLRRGVSSRSRPTVQEAARRLRYRALRTMAARAGAARIATGHNADDQAETVLLRLLRGCGPDGLGGIPECSPAGMVVRPLLRVGREEIASFARQRSLDWCEDESNRSPRYFRNRLRHHWLPGLTREFNPRLLRTIGNLAEAHRRDAEWIEQLVTEEAGRRFEMGPGWLRIAREGWAELPEALRRRLARRALRQMGGGREISRVHLERVIGFLRSGRPGSTLELPGGIHLVCDREAAELRSPRVEPGREC
jgi:tRNA(Ile)-lysidine synthase